MKKVLVISDLSENARAGIKFGLQMAAQGGFDLEFYHLIEIMKPTSWNDARFKSFSAQRIKEVEADLREQIKRASDEAGHPAELYPVKLEIGTKVAEKVTAYARKTKADYICLGTRGHGKMKKILGSNATDFLIKSLKPVIVVPPNYQSSTITKIVYASDFENLGNEIKKVKALSSELSADLFVYHYNRTLVISSNTTALQKKALKYGDEHTHFKYKKQDVDQSFNALLTNDLKKEKPSALVLFAKSRPKWYNRLFNPSKSAEMVLKPTIPIVVFRKKA